MQYGDQAEGDKLEALAKQYTMRFAQLRSDRGNFDQQWEETAARVLPSHRDTFTGNPASRQQGIKKTELAFDAKVGFAAQRFMAIIESLVTPVGSEWSQLEPTDPTLKKNRSVRQFFDRLNEVLFDYRYRPAANFVGNSQEVYLGLGCYGNGTLYIDRPEKSRGLRYRSIHLGETYFAENHARRVDTVYRYWAMDVRQMVQRFGAQNLPKDVVDQANQTTMAPRKYNILHVVHPAEDYAPGMIGQRGFPFTSCYLIHDLNKIIKIGGYTSFPYPVSRYSQAPGEVYGRGPAQWVLPAIKVVNEMKKTQLRLGHRAVDPVLLTHDDGNLGTLSLRPGTQNPGGVNAEGRPLVHVLPTGNWEISKEAIEGEHAVIEDAFLIKLFQILIETPEMTATEVLERAREKGMLLAPTAGRIESEFLGPMIEREVDLLVQQGLVPPPPAILAQAMTEYKAVYQSPISRMRRSERASGFMRSLDVAANYTKLTGDPSPLDWFSFDRAMPEVQDIMGAPVDWTATPEEVAQKRKDRSQQQQVQQIAEVAPALSGVVKAAK